MDLWYWHERFFDRMYGQTLPGYLLWFAMVPLVITTKTVIYPFQAISEKYTAIKEQQAWRQKEGKWEEKAWNQNQNALNSKYLFKQKLQEVKLNQRVLIVVKQKIESRSHSNLIKQGKGCLIVAQSCSCMRQFFPYLKKFIGINETESVTIYHSAKTRKNMISPDKLFGFIETNEEGFIEIEIVRLQTMG